MSFDRALADVTGHRAQLRAQLRARAEPERGWLIGVAPGTATWWNYYPYGEHIFAVDVNDRAVAEWNGAVGALTGIMPEVERGEHGLMSVPRLRAAESRIRQYAGLLAQTSAEARTIAGPVLADADIEGSAATEVARRTSGVADRLDAEQAKIGGGHVLPSLGAAADALGVFGRHLAGAYWDARETLEAAVDEGIAGVTADVVAYLARHGLASEDGVLYSFPTDDVARDSLRVRTLLAGFTPQHRVPRGMDEVHGDPTRPEFWAAASAAITERLTTALDELDDVAAHAQARLAHAYRAATVAMGGRVSEDGPVATAEPVGAGPGAGSGPLSSGLVAGTFGSLGTPLGSALRPLSPMVPRLPAQET